MDAVTERVITAIAGLRKAVEIIEAREYTQPASGLEAPMPDVTGLAATWTGDECLITWTDIAPKPATFDHYQITIDGIIRGVTMTFLNYTRAMNESDHGGLPSATLVIALVAVSVLGNISAIPATLTTTNPAPAWDTLSDNFDSYGGDEVAQGGSAALHWLSVARAEGAANEIYGSATLDATDKAEGESSLKVAAGALGYLYRSLSGDAQAIGFDGRFTDDDFYVVAAKGNGRSFYIYFGRSHESAYSPPFTATTGWNVFKVKRGDMISDITNWGEISQAGMSVDDTDAIVLRLDNLRISKADPDDPTTYNDTGQAWDFTGGAWFIFTDLRPSIPFALGQINTNTPGTRMTALRMAPTYVVSNHIACGVYLREAGKAGLLAFAIDGNNTYEIQIDSAADTLKILKWAAGVSTQLGSVAFVSTPNTAYRLAVERVGANLKIYATADTGLIFTAANLKMYVQDSAYVQGLVGVVAYGVNARFFQVRGGSPEHALTAEFAFEADRVNGLYLREWVGPFIVGTSRLNSAAYIAS